MKRFSDTARFDDPWFRTLPVEMKLAWEYVWAKCDNSGVWIVDAELAEFQIGKKVDWAKFIELAEGKICVLNPNKWAVVDFVQFQCGVLNELCRPHSAVIALLRSHGLLSEDSLSIVYPKGIDTLQDKDKDQDKEKDGQQKAKKPILLKPPAVAAQSDDEWLRGLQTVLAYEHLNVAAEYSRAKVWCETNRRQCTRKFFTNWLNRASANNREIAVNRPAQAASPVKRETPEEAFHRTHYTERVAAGLPPIL